MFRFFGSSAQKADALEQERFSRFDTGTRQVEMQAQQARYRRFTYEGAAPRREQPRAVTPALTEILAEAHATALTPPSQPPAPEMVAASDPLVDAAHLHSDAQIPLWVFRKALPQRYAVMHNTSDDFIFG